MFFARGQGRHRARKRGQISTTNATRGDISAAPQLSWWLRSPVSDSIVRVLSASIYRSPPPAQAVLVRTRTLPPRTPPSKQRRAFCSQEEKAPSAPRFRTSGSSVAHPPKIQAPVGNSFPCCSLLSQVLSVLCAELRPVFDQSEEEALERRVLDEAGEIFGRRQTGSVWT